MKTPFNKSVLLENHLDSIRVALESGDTSGNGVFGKKCEVLLSKIAGKPVGLTTSGSHALEMIGLLLRIEPGDEVILPSYTFSSTANAFALRGARLRFADNDEFGNILPAEVDRLLSPRTKAVMAVHYAGASADLDAILEICAPKQIPLVEDAAQALGALYKGRPLGAIGAIGCYSFHETKNVSSGEGGALICGDESFVARAEILREKGTNRRAFFQGLVDKYTWVDIGSSYILSELNAAYLLPQLEAFEKIQARRRAICERYADELKSTFDQHGIRILGTPAHNTPNYHMFAAIFQTQEERGDFIARMKEKETVCPFHYVPLHTSPFGRSFYNEDPENLPGCERIAHCLVRFPLYYNLSDDMQSHVIDNAKQILGGTWRSEATVEWPAVATALVGKAARPIVAPSHSGVFQPQGVVVQNELAAAQTEAANAH